MLHLIPTTYFFHISFPAGSDYEEVNVTLTFSQDSGNRQCFTITILDNSVFEDEENFILMILTESTPVTTVNASVFITDDEGIIIISMKSA